MKTLRKAFYLINIRNDSILGCLSTYYKRNFIGLSVTFRIVVYALLSENVFSLKMGNIPGGMNFKLYPL